MAKFGWFPKLALSGFTTWRVGGEATVVFRPQHRHALLQGLATISDHQPLLWLGLGSNTLVRDGGVAGITVITQGGLSGLQLVNHTEVSVEAGVSCATLARFCARHGLAGGEFWAGIPGTVGGALRMNAGCFNAETWQFVTAVETVDRHGKVTVRRPESFDIGYRQVQGLAQDTWFLSARMAFLPGDKVEAMGKIKALLARRSATQPTGEYNGGSVFRNPERDYAARLIEQSGLKGARCGGAMVSEKHANFIANDGTASAWDIERLIKQVANEVNARYQVPLVREVCIHGRLPLTSHREVLACD